MRRILGWILLFVGAFLLVTAIVLVTVGPGLAKRTPLDTNTSTFLSGQAQKLNPATGQVDDVPVKVLNRTKVDPKKSDSKVIVFVTYSCVNIDKDNPPSCLSGSDDRVVSNSVDTFATDRSNGLAVNASRYAGTKSTPHAGLVNKFPFDTKKQTYQYWDDLLGKAVPASYAGTAKVDGLSTYRFKVTVPKTAAKIAGDIEGTYQTDKTIWVEPRTGSIVDLNQHEVRLLPDGSTVLDINLAFTPETVKATTDEGKANVTKLNLLNRTGPIVTGFLGVLALVGGFLLIRGRRSEGSHVQQGA